MTRRSTQRQFLLRPDSETERAFNYCLAEAAERFGIDVIACVAMGNHYHGVFFDEHARLPAFLAHFHRMVALVLNARWKRDENFWSTRGCSIVLLVEDADVIEHVVYTLCNPTAQDLVDRALDWPGATTFHLMTGKKRERRFQRPLWFFRRDGRMPREAILRVVPPPTWRRRASEWAARVSNAVRVREQTHRAARASCGRKVVGRRRAMRGSPFARATSVERPRQLNPRLACRSIERRAEALAELRAFYAGYHASITRHLAGDRAVVFPPGTYRLRHLCAPSRNAGVVTAS